jgi:hypothetical protein
MIGWRVWSPLAAFLIAAAVAAPARAQEAGTPAPGAPPATEASAIPATPDTVFLRSGGFYRGQVTEIVPDDHVTLVVGSASKQIPWNEIDRIVASNGPGKPQTVLRVNAETSTPALPLSGAAQPGTPPVPASTPAQLEAPPVDATPRTAWRPNRPLLITGGVLFGIGYVPNLVAAAPSTVGLGARVVLIFLTLGLACLDGGSGGYVCSGQHGAMQLLIPFAGPFLFATDHPRDSVFNKTGRPLSDFDRGLLYASGGLQIAGLASVLTALALGKHEPVPGPKHTGAGPSFFVLPQTNAGAVGLTFGLHRW